MNLDDQNFLNFIAAKLKEKPYLLPEVVKFATAGVLEKNQEYKETQTTFEVIAHAAVSARYQNRFDFIKNKIKSLGNKTSLNWNNILGEDK